MVIRYRIYTEHIAPNLVSKYFSGFSIARVQGCYDGKLECSVIVEIIGIETDETTVRTLARDIREQYRQTEVWVTSEPITLTRVTIDAALEGL